MRIGFHILIWTYRYPIFLNGCIPIRDFSWYESDEVLPLKTVSGFTEFPTFYSWTMSFQCVLACPYRVSSDGPCAQSSCFTRKVEEIRYVTGLTRGYQIRRHLDGHGRSALRFARTARLFLEGSFKKKKKRKMPVVYSSSMAIIRWGRRRLGPEWKQGNSYDAFHGNRCFVCTQQLRDIWTRLCGLTSELNYENETCLFNSKEIHFPEKPNRFYHPKGSLGISRINSFDFNKKHSSWSWLFH